MWFYISKPVGIPATDTRFPGGANITRAARLTLPRAIAFTAARRDALIDGTGPAGHLHPPLGVAMIHGDAKREAIHSLGGYVYQALHALRAWLDLEPEASLFIEVAEDFAHLANGALNAVQVRRTQVSRPISLRTKQVRDTLGAFWRLRGDNPDLDVQVTYLTTSSIGKERAWKLPGAAAGLDYWALAAADADVEPLRAHILELDIEPSLKSWLRTAPPEAVRASLLRRIHWAVEAASSEAVRGQIDARLVALGETYGILPANAKAAFEPLLVELLQESIKAPPRVLTRPRLLEALERAATVQIPLGFRVRDGVERGRRRSQANERRIRALPPRIVGSIPTDVRYFVGRGEMLSQMSGFMRSAGAGVCTLHGLGGCGKSALLKQFELSEGLFRKSRTASPVAAAFSWSFSQHADLDSFFSELYRYLSPLIQRNEHTADDIAPRVNPLLLPDMIDASGARIVLILDGLEQVISDIEGPGARSGSLSAPALKALLQRAVSNECGNIKIFVTSRLLIPELQNIEQSGSILLDLNQLSPSDAVELLVRCEVRGTRAQLLSAARELRYHAYSVFLLGRALAAEYHGDVRRRDRMMPLGGQTGARSPIGQILTWYSSRLDRLASDLLKGAALYRGEIEVEDLTRLLESDVWPRPETTWNSKLIRAEVARLVDLGLIFMGESSTRRARSFDVHPIVRDYFYVLLVEPADLHGHILEILEARAPTRLPTDSRAVGHLVEMMYHAVRAKDFKQAWRIYSERLGGYPYLGYSRADHPTGAKAVYLLLEGGPNADREVPEDALWDLYVDGSLYLKNDGRLDDAIDLLEVARSKCLPSSDRPAQLASLLLVKSGTELLRGHVADAEQSARAARTEYEKVRTLLDERTMHRVEKECLSRLATALAVSADPEALPQFREAADIPDHPQTVPHDHLPIRYGWYLSLRGDYDAAAKVFEDGLASPQRLGADMLTHRVNAGRALNAIDQGKLPLAEAILQDLATWTTKPDLHVFVLTWVIRSKLALAKGEVPKAIALAKRGLRIAGENGFGLEWHDLALTLAKAAFMTGQDAEAAHYARLVLSGDSESYACEIVGASEPATNYVWASLPATYILIASLASSDEAGAAGGLPTLDETFKRMSALNHPFLTWLSTCHDAPAGR